MASGVSWPCWPNALPPPRRCPSHPTRCRCPCPCPCPCPMSTTTTKSSTPNNRDPWQATTARHPNPSSPSDSPRTIPPSTPPGNSSDWTPSTTTPTWTPPTRTTPPSPNRRAANGPAPSWPEVLPAESPTTRGRGTRARRVSTGDTSTWCEWRIRRATGCAAPMVTTGILILLLRTGDFESRWRAIRRSCRRRIRRGRRREKLRGRRTGRARRGLR
mmetsp:Transcript_5074/g.9305  ORF Transcript_5074/g.9305 Transcript_5074/m.9305 type:complete len:216 (+) Transcript_5074:93-740(+)